MVVIISVLTVLIAPSIDMPETVLREHHVAAHTMVNNGSGTLTVVGTIAVAEEFHKYALHMSESSRNMTGKDSRTPFVLRC